jgi:formate/nitrite transporter FocA (FNT family)
MRFVSPISDETSSLYTAATALGQHKLCQLGSGTHGEPWYALFVLSIFCGVLVFFAVELFKRETSSPLIKVVGIFVCVGGFVVSGFEHCIADMFYLSVSGCLFTEPLGTFLSILLGSSGNILGAFAAWFLLNYLGKREYK